MSRETTTAGQLPRVIQFPHPGFEYTASDLKKWSVDPSATKRDRTGVMRWKSEGTTHNRKYLLANGSALESTESALGEDVRLGFWGEWEAPSRWYKAEGKVETYRPSVFHEPLLPAQRPAESHQNTDPMVFGDNFLYTNCKMYRSAMRGMPPGSIVLFGRGMQIHGEPRFVLDTCFVVDYRHEPLETSVEDPEPYGQDMVTDLALAPLLSGSGSGHQRIHHYVGRRYVPGMEQPFSFFPAVRHDDQPEGFARPVLRPVGVLEGLLTETLKQGLKPNRLEDLEEAHHVWQEVVRQVLEQGCLLGVHAEPPNVRSLEAVLGNEGSTPVEAFARTTSAEGAHDRPASAERSETLPALTTDPLQPTSDPATRELADHQVHRASEVEEYLAERIRRPYPEGCPIVPGSTPVVSFGDVRSAWVATLGINPSDSEFIENGTWLEGEKRRFESLQALGLDRIEDAADDDIARIVSACYAYFDGPNPYWRWFRPLERVLNEGLGASYKDGTAAHLDLAQWATSPVWSHIPDKDVRRRLIEADRQFLRRQLQTEGIRLVLMNGKRVMKEVARMGVDLETIAESAPGEPRFEIRHGHLDGTDFVGWNLTFPNGGISKRQCQLIIDTVRQIGATLQPHTAKGGLDRGSIAKDTSVTTKRALVELLRGWADTDEKTIGDVGAFGGRPWVRIRLGEADLVLNADTKREAVLVYLDHVGQYGAESPWAVVANRSGKVNKVTFRADGAPTPGWYAYTARPLPQPTTI